MKRCETPPAQALWIAVDAEEESAGESPREVLSKPLRHHAVSKDGHMGPRVYTFCAFYRLITTLRQRDVFVSPSRQYADPRAGLLHGPEWEATWSLICHI